MFVVCLVIGYCVCNVLGVNIFLVLMILRLLVGYVIKYIWKFNCSGV